MKIAVASSDYLKITGHAGQARRRLVFKAEPGRPPVEIDRIEPPKDLVFHHWSGEGSPWRDQTTSSVSNFFPSKPNPK